MMKRRARTDEKTKPRKVSLTDAEWHEIKRQADRKGVSRSRYIAERTLVSGRPTSASGDIFDLLFAYREAVRVLDALLEAVFASPNEIDILFVMQIGLTKSSGVVSSLAPETAGRTGAMRCEAALVASFYRACGSRGQLSDV